MKVLITGASSGMGRDMAKIISSKADEIVLVARSEDKLKELKKEIEEISKAKVKIEVCDVSKADNCIKLHDNNKDVDLLINNAGFGDYGTFTETDLDKELRMIDTNITAYHVLTKLYLKDMKKRNSGHILNVASIAGFLPGPLMTTYYATKNYVVRMSEGIRTELKKEKSKVKISILCPGPVATGFESAANIGFAFPGVRSEKIAKYALDHLNRFYIVPGFAMKASRIFAHLIPSSWAANVVYAMQSTKKK